MKLSEARELPEGQPVKVDLVVEGPFITTRLGTYLRMKENLVVVEVEDPVVDARQEDDLRRQGEIGSVEKMVLPGRVELRSVLF